MIWLSVVALTISIIFLLRSLEIIPGGQPILNALICLLSLLITLYFLPSHLVSDSILQSFAWFIMIVAGGYVFFECAGSLSKKLIRYGSQKLQGNSGLAAEYNQICNALEQMAQHKTGALIVIERKKSLRDMCENAFKFDGEVKSEVIISLFDKNSPLHDGAMIISQNRIKSLKVILPLTTRADVPLGIGTRHRSAIGLTENTDAIALIASEERGMMSIAFQGALVVVNSKSQLTELLKTALKGLSIADVE